MQLSELFGASDDLIVIHNMGTSCSYCTLWGDGLNGWLPHFENRAAFAMVSPDSPEVQAAFAEERGWRFRMLSDAAKTFTDDMGFIRENEGERGPWPGYSTFHREQDGRILRVAYDSFGPGDPYCAVWHMLAHLDTGVDGWEPKFVY